MHNNIIYKMYINVGIQGQGLKKHNFNLICKYENVIIIWNELI